MKPSYKYLLFEYTWKGIADIATKFAHNWEQNSCLPIILSLFSSSCKRENQLLLSKPKDLFYSHSYNISHLVAYV